MAKKREVTVQAQANVLGMAAGETATVEETQVVRTHIDAKLLALIDADNPANKPADTTSSDGSGEASHGDGDASGDPTP